MLANEGDSRWPEQYYGIQLLPPLVYCPTHKRWEGYDESIPGLCDYCCLESPCPMGHTSDLSAWPEDEEDVKREREWKEREARRRHRTVESKPEEPEEDDTIVLEFLDWS